MKVLFVSYGGGHIQMCLPVMRALRRCAPTIKLELMALTTAFAVARDFGEPAFGYRDFCATEDRPRVDAYGRRLLQGEAHPSVSEDESLAYLGINFAEQVDELGEERAWDRWKRFGRQGFLPTNFFQRVLTRIKPDMVVTTNSPRSEEAAVAAASALGIPSLSMLDLFALETDPFLQRAVYADRLTVLSDATKKNLVTAGFDANRIFVTGNPAFDALLTPQAAQAGEDFRRAKGWEHKNVVLWAGDLEAANALPAELAGAGLARLVQDRLVSWIKSRNDVALIVRYHPNEWHLFQPIEGVPRVHWSQPDIEPLLPVLLASDQVVVQISTVGVQAHIAGKHLVNIGFSPYVRSTGLDYSQFGMSQIADNPEMLIERLAQGTTAGRAGCTAAAENDSAAHAVALQIYALLEQRSAL